MRVILLAVRGLFLLPIALAVAVLAQAAAASADGTTPRIKEAATVTDDLAGCVRRERASRPRSTDAEAAVRCVHLARMEATTVIRWSTCAGGGASDGSHSCETGSARVSIRSTRAVSEFRPPPPGWPRSARRWHLYGDGTVSCTRVGHDGRAGAPAAFESVSGRINHVDYAVLWPSPAGDGTLALGVSPLWSNPLPESLEDAIDRPRPCLPPFALDRTFLPQTRGIKVAEPLATDGVTARLRKTFLLGLGVPVPASIGPLVGRPLVIDVDTRISATFSAG